MGLISKATWLGVGYVMGARAGTARYEQIVRAGRRLAERPELEDYLGWLTRSSPPPDAGPAASTTPPAPVAPPVVEAPVLEAPVLDLSDVEPPVVELADVELADVEPPQPLVTVTRRGRTGRRRSS